MTELSRTYKFFPQTDYSTSGNPKWHDITPWGFSTSKEAFDYLDEYRKGSFNGISRVTWNCRVVEHTTICTVVEE